MIEVIDALERKGLIRRDPHPQPPPRLPGDDDRQGPPVLTACDAAVEEMEEEMLAGLSSDERVARRLAEDVRERCTRASSSREPRRARPTAAGEGL